jgi:hypothetical protein
MSGGTLLAVELTASILVGHNASKKRGECRHILDFDYGINGFIPLGIHVIFVIRRHSHIWDGYIPNHNIAVFKANRERTDPWEFKSRAEFASNFEIESPIALVSGL